MPSAQRLVSQKRLKEAWDVLADLTANHPAFKTVEILVLAGKVK